jgi:hypothetical protein
MARRKEPGEEEIKTAVGRIDEARQRILGGESIAEIGKSFHVPSAALERALAVAASPSSAPPVTPASPPPPPAGVTTGRAAALKTGPDPDEPGAAVDAISDLLGGGSTGSEYDRTLKLMQQSEVTDLRVAYLKAKLEETQLANAERRARLERRAPGDGGADRDRSRGDIYDTIKNNRDEELRRQYVEAEIQRIRSGGSAGGESEKLRLENDALRSELRDKRLLDSLDSRLTPLVDRLRKLEERPDGRRTEADVHLDSLARAEALKYDAQGRLVSEGTARLQSAPHLGTKLEKIADQVIGSSEFQKRLRTIIAEPSDMEGEVVEPSPEHIMQVARELEGIASDGQSAVAERRPSRLVPGSWLPKAPDEPAT